MKRCLWIALLALLALAGCDRSAEQTPAPPETAAPVETAGEITPVTPPTRRPRDMWPTASPTAAGATATGTVATEPAAIAEVTPPSPTPLPPTVPPPPACAIPPGWQPQPVVPGDTVGRLAACVGAPVAEVLTANCLPPSGPIYAGEILWLPRLCVPTATATAAAGDSGQGGNPARTTVPTIDVYVPQPGSGVLAIEPSEAGHGMPVTLSLSNFDAYREITLTFVYDLETYATRYVTVGALGAVDYVLWVPAWFPVGYIEVTATDPLDLTKDAVGGFVVIPPTAAPATETTTTPTAVPTTVPTSVATTTPTADSTLEPTAEATATPTTDPATEPTAAPTAGP